MKLRPSQFAMMERRGLTPGEIRARWPFPLRGVFVGVDLGTKRDHSALVAMEWRGSKTYRHRAGDARRFDVVLAQKWDLGVTYPRIIADVLDFLRAPEILEHALAGRLHMTVDASGPGLGVFQQLEAQMLADPDLKAMARSWRLTPALIRGGHGVTHGRGTLNVAKDELVNAAVVLIESGELRMVEGCPLAEDLTRELEHFRMKRTKAGNLQFEAAGSHKDDLAIALALAAWSGLRESERYGGCQLVPAPDGVGWVEPG